jgi:ribonuclease PH
VQQRIDGRRADQLRPVSFEPGYLTFTDGSVLISVGNTRVICAATIEDRVPPWMRGRGTGWITAEYAMLPGATPERNQRESSKGRRPDARDPSADRPRAARRGRSRQAR